MASLRVIAILCAGIACAKPVPPKPPATPPLGEHDAGKSASSRIPAGKDCVYATARCDVALCAAEIHNECELPVICELVVAADCGAGAASAQVRTKGRDTFPSDTAGTLEAAADCGEGTVAATVVVQLACR